MTASHGSRSSGLDGDHWALSRDSKRRWWVGFFVSIIYRLVPLHLAVDTMYLITEEGRTVSLYRAVSSVVHIRYNPPLMILCVTQCPVYLASEHFAYCLR